MTEALLAIALVASFAAPATANDDFAGAYVIFARGESLLRTDPKGKGEREIAKLPTKAPVRALRTDEAGKILLANVAGKWSWMPLDGTTSTLTELPCADGPAHLATDGSCVLCRGATPTSSLIINFATNNSITIPIPTTGARIVGSPPDRKLVWNDASGVWASPPNDPRKKTLVAPTAPLRGFLPNPAGTRAVGVYSDVIHDSPHTTKPAELLMTFALDGQGARRKTVKAGVVADWSYNNEWLLMQDRTSACIVHAAGGQYKCWKGFTAASISNDGKWALILGSREKAASATKKSSRKNAKKNNTEPRGEPSNESENRAGAEDEISDDVEVPLPTGNLSLYRAQLDGAYTTAPAKIISVLDGAAVWIPGPRD
ncbi:MAG: hypothetical protein ACKV2T_14990 [Kofleriaceae bacterium]